jgi:hypothetical protein
MNLSNLRVAAAINDLSDQYAAAGWEKTGCLQADEHLEGTAVYFCDLDTNELIALELVEDAIERLNEAPETKLPFNQVASALSTLVGEIATGALPFDRNSRNLLCAGVALYLINSEPYRIAQAQSPPFTQFLVVRYPDVNRGDYVLRVLPLMGTSALDPLTISDLSNHLLNIDRGTHPERFAPDVLVEFKPRTFKE